MTDAAAISAGLQSLKAAFDIGKALLSLSVNAQVRERIIEMNSQILAAQESAISSREYQSALLNQISKLENRITEFETWNAEAETYQLTDLRPNDPFGRGSVFAYAPKEGTHTTEPAHLICAECFQNHKKSFLQQETRYPGLCKVLYCVTCPTEIYLEGHWYPQHSGRKLSRRSSER